MNIKNDQLSSKKRTLKELLASIVSSVAQAQSELIESQTKHLFNYFEKKNKKDANGNETAQVLPGYFPISVDVGMPCSTEEEYRTKYYSIPLINLLHISNLHIDKIDTEFDVGFVELETIQPSEDQGGLLASNMLHDDNDVNVLSASSDLGAVSIDVLGAGFNKDKGIAVHLKMSMKAHEIPEGGARLLNELINTTQGYSKEIITKKASPDA